ncbi:uncharacterized protein LOC116231674 [Phasianus colchicus]|uniref:uncharacterized protein LOC116231674 n=1 Tax=Phasianus colchicus TaxID=9054 RepID=UPI00129D46BC|nr:uncharacterized protein LOC116231674 [Phasianus colchicus]
MRCYVPQRRVRVLSTGCWLITRQDLGCWVRALGPLAASARSGAACTGTVRCRCGSVCRAGLRRGTSRGFGTEVNGCWGVLGAVPAAAGPGAGWRRWTTWWGFLGDHSCGGGRDVRVWWRCSPSSRPVPLRVWGCAAGAWGCPEQGGCIVPGTVLVPGQCVAPCSRSYWGCARPARSPGGPAAPPSRSLRRGWGTREGSGGARAPSVKTKRLPKMDEEHGLPQRQGSVAVSDARCRPPVWLRPPPDGRGDAVAAPHGMCPTGTGQSCPRRAAIPISALFLCCNRRGKKNTKPVPTLSAPTSEGCAAFPPPTSSVHLLEPFPAYPIRNTGSEFGVRAARWLQREEGEVLGHLWYWAVLWLGSAPLLLPWGLRIILSPCCQTHANPPSSDVSVAACKPLERPSPTLVGCMGVGCRVKEHQLQFDPKAAVVLEGNWNKQDEVVKLEPIRVLPSSSFAGLRGKRNKETVYLWNK